jgi:hypothetical protein
MQRLVTDIDAGMKLFGLSEWRLFEERQTKVIVTWAPHMIVICIRGSYKAQNFWQDVKVCKTHAVAVPDLLLHVN